MHRSICVYVFVKVMVVPNFKGATFINDGVFPQELIDKQFTFGAKLELTRRITVSFGPEDSDRHDIAKGTATFVEGYDGILPRVKFSATCELKCRYDKSTEKSTGPRCRIRLTCLERFKQCARACFGIDVMSRVSKRVR